MTTTTTEMTPTTKTSRSVRFFYMRDGRRTVTVAYKTSQQPDGTFECKYAFATNRQSIWASDEFSKKRGREIATGRLDSPHGNVRTVTHPTVKDIHFAIAKDLMDCETQAVQRVAQSFLMTLPKKIM